MRFPNALPLILAIAALPAQATTTYYCDSSCGSNTAAVFNAAFGALISAGMSSSGTVNFLGEASGTTVSDVGPTQVDFSGVNGVNPATLNVVGSQLQHTVGGTNTGILISMPANTFAIGFHVTTPSANKFWCFEITAPNCDTGVMIFTNGTTSFVGVISDTPLPNLQFRQPSGTGILYVNDFSIAETPEGPTYLMMGLGLISLPLLKRRVLRAQRAVQNL